MEKLIEEYATRMGMKAYREVKEVVPVDGGHAVRTHDGRWTLVRDDGVMELVDTDKAAMLRGFHGEPEAKPAADPAPKPRSRA